MRKSRNEYPKKGIRLTAHHATVLSAVLGHSNMGMGLPPVDIVRRLKNNEKTTLSSAVIAISQEYMENDEHLEMFETEARDSFLRDKTWQTVEFVRKTWPDIAALYFDEKEQASGHR